MNAQMRLVIMLTSVAVSGSLLFAAEPAQKEPQPAASEQKPAQQKRAEPKPAGQKAPEQVSAKPDAEAAAPTAQAEDAKAPAEERDPAPKPAATSADKAGSPQRFNPSEQVRADFDVSFPIDI